MRRWCLAPPLGNFFAVGNLADAQKSRHEFAPTARDQSGKAFEPSADWHFRVSLQPIGHSIRVARRDFSLVNPID